MSRVSQPSMAWYPEENPISPVIPTSKGLSHSMCSLPRSACTMGALSLAARATTASWAPAQPAPQRSVVLSPLSRKSTKSSMSASAAHTRGNRDTGLGEGVTGPASFKAVSPEITGTNLGARNMRRDGHHGHAVAMAIKEPIDQVQVAGATAPGAYSDFAR